jgi:endonuclease G, mitochondrial
VKRTSMESLLKDKEIMEELRAKAKGRSSFRGQSESSQGRRAIVDYLADPFGPVEGVHTTESAAESEAIILEFGRPSLLIRDGKPDKPDSETWKSRLRPHESRVATAIPAVGRIELRHHPDYEWVGTGWLIENRYLVTNRHVAMIFAEKRGSEFVFRRSPSGPAIESRIDFREEYERSAAFELNIERVHLISPLGELYPDMAVLRVKDHVELPSPLLLADRDAEEGQLVGVIGYPARDSRNGDVPMQRIFNDIFDKKRFAPGYVTSQDAHVLQHDSSTLGGNSGSPVIELATGHVVGLHFGGRFKETNYAVPVSVIKRTLAGVSVMGGVGAGGGSDDTERRTVEDYVGREGFDENFLGTKKLRVPLPELNDEQRDDAVEVKPEARGMGVYALDYTHFSVVLCKSRRLAYFTAVNIDGSQDVSLRRRSTPWKIDPRVPTECQCGPEVYEGNKLDRGHLVRRLDPVWGDDETAKLADDDTFHYSNAAPQHERLNQKTWLSLEEYILSNAATADMKINVFTGPVFSDRDVDYRDVQIPSEFWKVVTMVTTGKKLHATAYLLSQGSYLDDIEFVYGKFKTYQTTIANIEKKTGLDFGKLSEHDPIGTSEGVGFLQPISEASDIII